MDSKCELLQIIKANSLLLSELYNNNLKIEIEVDVNPKLGSAKLKITEHIK